MIVQLQKCCVEQIGVVLGLVLEGVFDELGQWYYYFLFVLDVYYYVVVVDFFDVFLFVFDDYYIVQLDWLGYCDLQVSDQVVEYWFCGDIGYQVDQVC